MRWSPGGGTSDDIEDRRSEGGGGGGGFRLGGGHIGIFGGLVLLVLSLIFKQNFFALLGGDDSQTQTQPSSPTSTAGRAPVNSTPQENQEVKFVSFVIDDVQKVWTQELPKNGANYQHAHLVLYRDGIQSGCGNASSSMGPFYCPTDHKVYLDLGFFDELKGRFGAPGEFAEAYVIAHELGHHVQNTLGLDSKLRQAQASGNQGVFNATSVKFELQADCLAGVWAHSTDQRNLLEKGDVESAMRAAAAVGDDRLQKQATGRIRPESWTHGSSQQRVEWFTRGMKTGKVEACDTFAQ